MEDQLDYYKQLAVKIRPFLETPLKYELLGSVWGYLGNYSMVSSIVEIKLSFPITLWK